MQAYKDANGDLIMDTAALEGVMLDYWTMRVCGNDHEKTMAMLVDEGVAPSTNWDYGGPIIHVHRIAISPVPPTMEKWVSCWIRPAPSSLIVMPPNGSAGPPRVVANADTPLRAAMVALVFGYAGDRVAVPQDVQALMTRAAACAAPQAANDVTH